MALVLARFGDDRVAEAVLAYRAHYGVEGFRATEFYPGVSEALEQLAGTSLYVATSKRTVFARRILEHLGASAAFVDIYGSEPDGALDQKAELIAHVLQRHDLPRFDLQTGIAQRHHSTKTFRDALSVQNRGRVQHGCQNRQHGNLRPEADLVRRFQDLPQVFVERGHIAGPSVA